MKRDNLINMDSRSVLSMIPLIEDSVALSLKKMTPIEFRSYVESKGISDRGVEYINSYISENALHNMEEILSWMTNLKFVTQIIIEKIPLRDLKNWTIGENEIHHVQKTDTSALMQ